MTLSSTRGFTLVELIVVVLILGVLSATALPRFMQLGDRAVVASLETAKGALVSATNLVQSKAQLLGMGPGVDGDIEGIWTHNGYPVFANQPSSDVDHRPEILEMANMSDSHWVYRNSSLTRPADGSGKLLLTLKKVLEAPANLAAIEATHCYVSYVQYWAGNSALDPINHRPPEIDVVSSGC